jgi:beta-lactamase class A
MLERRQLLKAMLAATSLLAVPAAAAPTARRFDAAARLRALESGPARLGVCLLDTVTGESTGNRLGERFAMCSTFKLPLVAACLREADRVRLDLGEILPYSEEDLLPWAPFTREHVANGGMNVVSLMQAAQELSDGVAANLLVRRLGGPAAVTQLFRDMGDSVIRLDRYEPDLARAEPGEERDTTTPEAMARFVGRITTGDVLQPQTRDLLLNWMERTQTGVRRLRAGLPADWRSGNKTGTARDEGTTNKVNDVAVTFPPGRNPIVIAAYYDSGVTTDQIEPAHEAVLAEVGRIAAEWSRSGNADA